MNTNYLQALNIISTVKMAINEGYTSTKDFFAYEILLNNAVFQNITIMSDNEKEAEIAMEYNVLFSQIKIRLLK